MASLGKLHESFRDVVVLLQQQPVHSPQPQHTSPRPLCTPLSAQPARIFTTVQFQVFSSGKAMLHWPLDCTPFPFGQYLPPPTEHEYVASQCRISAVAILGEWLVPRGHCFGYGYIELPIVPQWLFSPVSLKKGTGWLASIHISFGAPPDL